MSVVFAGQTTDKGLQLSPFMICMQELMSLWIYELQVLVYPLLYLCLFCHYLLTSFGLTIPCSAHLFPKCIPPFISLSLAVSICLCLLLSPYLSLPAGLVLLSLYSSESLPLSPNVMW